jgi:lipopolysaccharide/colanic/teichoic acid biosynthesis glycosyltransferase
LAAAALLVRAESKGSPLFGHIRIGRGGTRFRCWKLRTMRSDAEQLLASDPDLFARYRANDFKLPDAEDPRITRMGRLLRKTSIDELPQLWNVFCGEMSLVGPRPIVAEELPNYRGDVLTLLSVRPGITGAWAVSGRHHLAYPRRAEVELGYVRSRSFSTDATILLRTIGAVLDPGFGLRS